MSKPRHTSRRGKKPSAAPVMRRLAKRGRPFEKGNSNGISTRFAPGVSGNPGGRPRSAKYSDSLRQMVAADVGDTFKPQTNADIVARKVFRLAKRGNLGAIRELGDRCEGRPAQNISVNGEGDNLKTIISIMTSMSEVAGPPEGFVARALPAGEAVADEQSDDND
jgi:uncharacterized protein DUF5681